MIQTDVCVLGAGPGGVAASLQLAKLGISSIVVDKAVFPRDKICGDSISGKVPYVFNRIDKEIFKDFISREDLKYNSWGVEFIYPDRKIQIDYKPGITKAELELEKPVGFLSKRMDFDNYLVDYIKKEPLVDLREGVQITAFERNETGYILYSKDKSTQIQAKLVIVADGAQSKFARQIGKIEIDPKHYAGSVRAYYKNVKGGDYLNRIELHFLKRLEPGYLWIFPLPNGEANVGIGMRTDLLKERKVNLKKEMIHVLKDDERFKDRFKDAELIGNLQGFGLPLGSKKRVISGDHFMLIGDAASLIDPLTGEGIGNATVSGRFAALHAAEALKANDFSAKFLSKYDKMVYDKLWKELRVSTFLQNAYKYKWLSSTLKRLANNRQFIEILSAIFSDVDLKKKLFSPVFYYKLIFNR
ncbi:MAG: NAD(P)/FAD-dependent oxidoreductase [Saprospiraceae bacterium]